MIYLLVLYGDWDNEYVDSVWSNDSKVQIPDFGNDRDGSLARQWLKSNKFKELKTTKIICGGNY